MSRIQKALTCILAVLWTGVCTAVTTDIRRDAAFPRSVNGLVDMGRYQGCVPGPGFTLRLR